MSEFVKKRQDIKIRNLSLKSIKMFLKNLIKIKLNYFGDFQQNFSEYLCRHNFIKSKSFNANVSFVRTKLNFQ